MVETIPLLCGSVAGKASPLGVKLHDAGYKALNLDYKYIAIGTEDLTSVMISVQELRFRGLGVSMPFKQQILRHLDEITKEVQATGACNTVVIRDNHFTGYNTDWRGALAALDEAVTTRLENATIIGSGGVARSIAYGLKQRGLKVYIAARSVMRRSELVETLELDGECSLEKQGQYGSSLIVNATPVAEYPESPVNLMQHPHGEILLDVVFQKKETPLDAEALRRGLRVVPGWRMLLHQALGQFELYTGHRAPSAEMEAILSEALG